MLMTLADGREHDHLAVEAARDRAELGGAQRRAVLAPEVDLVARIEHGAERRRCSAACRRRERVRRAVEIDRGQQRRAGDARLRIGLLDARDRGRDVEIGELRALDQRRSARASGSRATSPAPGSAACGLPAAARYFGGVSTTGTAGASRSAGSRTAGRAQARSTRPLRRAARFAAVAPDGLIARVLPCVSRSRRSARIRCAAPASRQALRGPRRHLAGRRCDRSPASPARRPAAPCAPRPKRGAQLRGIERLGAQRGLDALERAIERLAPVLGRGFARAERGAQLLGVGRQAAARRAVRCVPPRCAAARSRPAASARRSGAPRARRSCR